LMETAELILSISRSLPLGQHRGRTRLLQPNV
jgi:hypothetical protein